MAWEIDFASRHAGWPLNHRRHEGAQHLQGGRRRHPGMATTALVKIEARSKSKLALKANGLLQAWIHGITAGTLCTTRAHGSARATMYTQLAAHGIECGTTYSTCVHCTKLDTAYTLHRLQLVRTSIPAAQLMHSVPTAVPPIPHLSGAGTICDTMHTTCAQGTGVDHSCGSLSRRGIHIGTVAFH